MEYRLDKHGNQISALGFGCMRFAQSGNKIDMKATEEQLIKAYKEGVNYFDTAYIYSGSEAAVGEIFEKNGMREKVNIATKLPQYLIKKKEDLDKYFNEELSRLRTTYVDYYLMHMLNDIKAWERLKTLGIEEWIKAKMSEGKIRQIGFSYHGNTEMFCKILDDYDWDFCQIQYNYYDEHSQAGRKGLDHAKEKGIPVVIMEPLRGGRLVKKLPKDVIALFDGYKIKRTPAEWAFRWLWNQEGIMCVLSGMNTMEMLEENIKTASTSKIGDFTEEDSNLLKEVVKKINEKQKVGCTGCRYCMPCPQGVDIPGTFAAYNAKYAEGFMSAEREYIMCTALRKDSSAASKCIKCGKCEMHCPQKIEIRKHLEKARKELETPIYKVARAAIKIMKMY